VILYLDLIFRHAFIDMRVFILQSGGSFAREMMLIDAAASSFSTKQRGLLQSIWGLRDLGLSWGETRP
jgi:hypothetical protein